MIEELAQCLCNIGCNARIDNKHNNLCVITTRHRIIIKILDVSNVVVESSLHSNNLVHGGSADGYTSVSLDCAEPGSIEKILNFIYILGSVNAKVRF